MATYVQTVDILGAPVAINPFLVQGVTLAAGVVPTASVVRTATEVFVLPGDVATVTALLGTGGTGLFVSAPLTGDGSLGSPLSIPASTSLVDGYMSAAQAAQLAGTPAAIAAAVAAGVAAAEAYADAAVAALAATLVGDVTLWQVSGLLNALTTGFYSIGGAATNNSATNPNAFKLREARRLVSVEWYLQSLTLVAAETITNTVYKNGVAVATHTITWDATSVIGTYTTTVANIDFAADDVVQIHFTYSAGVANHSAVGTATLQWAPFHP